MNRPKAISLVFFTFGLILTLALLWLLQAKASLEGGTFIITRWNIDNGGGESNGLTFNVQGTSGQSDAGQQSGSTYTLYSGFWGPLHNQAVTSAQFLPTLLNNVSFCLHDLQEVEPNNTRNEATGLLCNGQIYQGAPNDQKDYFTFVTNSNGNIVIDLTGHTGTGVQMQMFYQNETTPRAFDTDPGPDFHIAYNGPAGQYYIYIFTASGYTTTPLYNLVVNYP